MYIYIYAILNYILVGIYIHVQRLGVWNAQNKRIEAELLVFPMGNQNDTPNLWENKADTGLLNCLYISLHIQVWTKPFRITVDIPNNLYKSKSRNKQSCDSSPSERNFKFFSPCDGYSYISTATPPLSFTWKSLSFTWNHPVAPTLVAHFLGRGGNQRSSWWQALNQQMKA